MFTGIIEEVGIIERVARRQRSAVLTLRAEKVLEGTRTGDSIAVNGVCLTVTALERGRFHADVMHETLDRSTLAHLKAGSRVNLERAMRADGRFGGHIVAGHVDGVGTIIEVRRDDTAVWFTVEADAGVLRYVVEKGSIAMDGISLTVASVEEDRFSVSTIPHTLRETTLCDRMRGDRVNIETDIVGKYVEKLMGFQEIQEKEKKCGSVLTEAFLAENGFM